MWDRVCTKNIVTMQYTSEIICSFVKGESVYFNHRISAGGNCAKLTICRIFPCNLDVVLHYSIITLRSGGIGFI